MSRVLITNRSPLSGLSRRRLGFLPVFAQSVAAVAPCGAMAVIPALADGDSGDGVLLAFLAAAVVMLLVSACIRPLAQRMATVGGLYSYTAKGLGPVPGVAAGLSAIFGYGAIAMACLLSVATYVSKGLASIGIPVTESLTVLIPILVVAGLIACLLMVRGVRVSARATLAIESISIVVVLTLLVVLISSHGLTGRFAPTVRWPNHGSGLGASIVIAVSAFVGFESATTLGAEAYRPFISVPRAVRWTPIATALIFLFAVPVQAMALARAPRKIHDSATPLVDLFAAKQSAFLAVVLEFGIAASFFACTVASSTALVRVLFCMGREGVAPRRLGATHPRFQTPWVAIITALPIITLAPVVLIAAGRSIDRSLVVLFSLGAFGYLGNYLAVCVALPVLLHRIGEDSTLAWAKAGIATSALVAIAWAALVVPIHDGRYVPMLYAAFVAVSFATALGLRLANPTRLRAVGMYDETIATDRLDATPRGVFR